MHCTHIPIRRLLCSPRCTVVVCFGFGFCFLCFVRIERRCLQSVQIPSQIAGSHWLLLLPLSPLLCRAEEEAEEARIAVEEAQAAAAGILGAFSSTTYQIRYNASVVIQVRSDSSLHSHSPVTTTMAWTASDATVCVDYMI